MVEEVEVGIIAEIVIAKGWYVHVIYATVRVIASKFVVSHHKLIIYIQLDVIVDIIGTEDIANRLMSITKWDRTRVLHVIHAVPPSEIVFVAPVVTWCLSVRQKKVVS